MEVKDIVWLIPTLPLLGMLITGLGGRMLTRSGARMIATYIATACTALSLVVSIYVATQVADLDHAVNVVFYTWIPSGDFSPEIGFWVDRLTAVMLLVVTGVATLVHIYAIGYMKDDGRDPSVVAHGGGHGDAHGATDNHATHEAAIVHGGHDAPSAHGDDHVAEGTGESGTQPTTAPIDPATRPGNGGWRISGALQKDGGLARFFSFLNLFVFSMLVLVLANNYLMLFVGWELVGLSSFLLIGFWYQKRDIFQDIKGFFRKDVPFEASKKAFIVNRIGDFGLATGIMLMFVNFGSLAFGSVFQQAPNQTFILGNMTVMCLLLFMGAMGKSAQFPLHVWLPDAMAGPTPVSALIHAATMVTAGVYLVARSNPVFSHAPDAMLVVMIIGTITALLGATIACTATDLKQVVAYSTVSQLGYMFAALGGGLWIAAIFHLFTHAFFKGLLFLGSGSVLHGMHDLEGEGKDGQDIRWMGGLARYMPITATTFIIGALANAGIVPLGRLLVERRDHQWADHQQHLGRGCDCRRPALDRLLPDRLLYVPPCLPGLFQPEALGPGSGPPARVAAHHDHPADDPGRRGGVGRLPGRAARSRHLPSLLGPGVSARLHGAAHRSRARAGWLRTGAFRTDLWPATHQRLVRGGGDRLGLPDVCAAQWRRRKHGPPDRAALSGGADALVFR